MRPQKVIVKDNRSGTSALSCPSNVVRPDRYSCSVEIFDSMSMSRNALDSNISRQSIHSTYSASSSRETTCTRGWIHCLSMDLLYRWAEVLAVGWFMFIRNRPLVEEQRNCPVFSDRLDGLSSIYRIWSVNFLGQGRHLWHALSAQSCDDSGNIRQK